MSDRDDEDDHAGESPDEYAGASPEEQAGESPDDYVGESPDDHAGDVPLSGLRRDIERRRRKRVDDSTDVEEAFEEAASEPVIDGEQVWEDLLSSQDEEAGVLAFGEVVEGETEDVRVIPDRICHNCKYFGDPPELHCTHEGTDIRRVADMDHYEVVDCPVVKNRSDLRGE